MGKREEVGRRRRRVEGGRRKEQAREGRQGGIQGTLQAITLHLGPWPLGKLT
jgi:hypothetical protein